ncbi:MAG: hypothetical protein JNL72_11880 [Flavipsychrobacter sp.]|nr:hypothetical protein [Flavipsychrobacter sp.]
MRIVVVSTLALLFLSSFTPGAGDDCRRFRTGKFKNVYEGITTLIERTDSLQIETIAELGVVATYKLVWVDDCTFRVLPFKTMKGGVDISEQDTMTCTMQITHVSGNSYQQLVTCDNTDINVTCTITRIE